MLRRPLSSSIRLDLISLIISLFTVCCHSSKDRTAVGVTQTSLSPSFANCDIRGGWSFRDESCYFVVKVSPREWRPYTKVRFNDYRRACAKINASLPVIGDEKEHEFLRAHTKYGDGLFNAFDYYLGIRHIFSEGPKSNPPRKLSWRWIDGKPASDGYSPENWRFDPSYPCVTLGWTGWRNELCWQWDTRDLYAVCERPYDATCKELADSIEC